MCLALVTTVSPEDNQSKENVRKFLCHPVRSCDNEQIYIYISTLNEALLLLLLLLLLLYYYYYYIIIIIIIIIIIYMV